MSTHKLRPVVKALRRKAKAKRLRRAKRQARRRQTTAPLPALPPARRPTLPSDPVAAFLAFDPAGPDPSRTVAGIVNLALLSSWIGNSNRRP